MEKKKDKNKEESLVEETIEEETSNEETAEETSNEKVREENPKEEPKESISSDDVKFLVDEVKELRKQNEMLLEVADKRALAHYYSKNQKKIPKEIKLNLIEGRVVLSWKMTRNEVYKDSTTQRWIERQESSLLLEDGKTLEMPYTDFIRRYTQVPATVVSTSKDEETGKLVLKVSRLDTGKEYSIEAEYIN